MRAACFPVSAVRGEVGAVDEVVAGPAGWEAVSAAVQAAAAVVWEAAGAALVEAAAAREVAEAMGALQLL